MPETFSQNSPEYRPKKRLRNRLILSFTILTSCLIAFIIVFVGNKQKEASLHQARERGLAIAESIAGISTSYLLAYDYVALTKTAEQAMNREDIVYVIILDKEGRVAAYSSHPERQGERLEDDLSIRALKAERLLVSQSKQKGDRVLDIAIPVFIEKSGGRWGTVRVGLSLERIYAEIFETRLVLALTGLTAWALVIAISMAVARRITRPVEDLVKATVAASAGKLDQNLNVHTEDEIEQLALSFVDMMREISSQRGDIEEKLIRITALQKYNDLVLESMVSGLVTFDANSKANIVNRAGKDILEIRGTDDLEAGEAFQELRDAAASVVRNEETFLNRELKIKKINGAGFLEVSASPMHGEGGTVIGAIVVFQDVTPLKELQEKLQRADRLSAVGTVASGLAHDIRNPLSAIRTFVQLLPLKKENEDFFNQFNLTVPRELERINRTIENLLELSRKPTMSFGDLDLNKLLDHILNVYSNELLQKNIEVKKQYLSNARTMKGDVEYLNRAFSNLIVNAIEAMGPSGTLSVSTRVTETDLSVEIKDTGAGMDEETAGNIFNPYFTTKRKGSGLGLSIAHKIIEEHNGSIRFESMVGKGTTFIVNLPLTAPAITESSI